MYLIASMEFESLEEKQRLHSYMANVFKWPSGIDSLDKPIQLGDDWRLNSSNMLQHMANLIVSANERCIFWSATF